MPVLNHVLVRLQYVLEVYIYIYILRVVIGVGEVIGFWTIYLKLLLFNFFHGSCLQPLAEDCTFNEMYESMSAEKKIFKVIINTADLLFVYVCVPTVFGASEYIQQKGSVLRCLTSGVATVWMKLFVRQGSTTSYSTDIIYLSDSIFKRFVNFYALWKTTHSSGIFV